MVTNVSLDNRRNLESAGFAVSRSGFNRKHLPLIAHKKTVGVKIGDVQVNMRLDHPKQLNEYESMYLSKKAAAGIMPWMPGEECLKREMKDFEVTQDPGTGAARVRVIGSHFGCKWCRAEQESQGEAVGVKENLEIEPSSFSEALSTSPVTIKCDICTYVPEATKNGKQRTEGQIKMALNAHKRFKHKEAVTA